MMSCRKRLFQITTFLLLKVVQGAKSEAQTACSRLAVTSPPFKTILEEWKHFSKVEDLFVTLKVLLWRVSRAVKAIGQSEVFS